MQETESKLLRKQKTLARRFLIQEKDPYEDWTFVTKLGEGTFGAVNQYSNFGRHVAVKQFKKTVESKLEFELELQGYKNAGFHERIVEFKSAFITKHGYFLALELCRGGDLRNIYKDFRDFKETDVREITLQLCRALGHLRDQRIAHRDIKPGNIFVRSFNPINVALGDMNFSKRAQDEAPTLTVFSTNLGTCKYKAPEVRNDAFRKATVDGDFVYNHRCDIWSLGVVVYELLSGRWEPFVPNEQALVSMRDSCDEKEEFLVCLQQAIEAERLNGELQFLPEVHWQELVSEEATIVLRHMLEKNYQHRWDVEQVLGSSWFLADLANGQNLLTPVGFAEKIEELQQTLDS